jgi:Flp pilus assembly pilin Flp
MKTTKRFCRRQQQGVAAVEFALVLPVIVLLIALTLLFGRIFWHYTVAVKAASDVATFMTLTRNSEMLEARPDLGEISIVKLARSIGETELAELSPGKAAMPVIDISCDGAPCRGDFIPNEILVIVRMRMYSAFMPEVLKKLGDMDGMWLRAEVRVRYAGA